MFLGAPLENHFEELRLTGDGQGFVVVHGLGEEARGDQFGADDEADLFLDAAPAEDAAADEPVGEVDLLVFVFFFRGWQTSVRT